MQPDYVLDFTSWRKSRNEDAKLRIMENAGPKCATTSMGHGKEILTLLIFTMSIWVRS